MNHDICMFLEDILLAINIIEQHIKGIENIKDYTNDLKTIDSVERRLAIIGEALFKANKIDATIPISDKTKIIALRHILVHEYNLINHETIWKIITVGLPVLKQEVAALLHS